MGLHDNHHGTHRKKLLDGLRGWIHGLLPMESKLRSEGFDAERSKAIE